MQTFATLEKRSPVGANPDDNLTLADLFEQQAAESNLLPVGSDVKPKRRRITKKSRVPDPESVNVD